MNEMLILGGLLIGLWALILFLRVPASVAFFSLLVGQLLATEAGNDAYEFVSGVVQVDEIRYVQLALLLLPLILTIIFMRGRVKKSMLAVELVPALFVSAVTLMLAYPLIPELKTIVDTATQDRSQDYRTVLLLAAAVSGIISAWMSYPKPADKHGKHHK
jgi:hypothetical protein